MANTKKFFMPKLSGDELLNNPLFNKGTAFTYAERRKFNLLGKLPEAIETLEQQVSRAYAQYLSYQTAKQKNLFLTQIRQVNLTLFYKLVSTHIEEMLPIIYTPTAAAAIHDYSHDFIRPAGLYITPNNINNLQQILEGELYNEIAIIIVTDGERILGIGDQGVGGIGICTAKLTCYSVFANIYPAKILPIVLDVGTNNPELLSCPYYLGLRKNRLTGAAYDDFMEKFIQGIKQVFPHIFLHFEDFGRNNATSLLEKYRNKVCALNDDIQGTSVVVIAALLAALHSSKQKLAEQKIVFFGAGSTALGIANQIASSMQREGINQAEIPSHFWMIDYLGLLTDQQVHWNKKLKLYQKTSNDFINWEISNKDHITLFDVVKNVKPTVLIGCSTVQNAFTEEIVREMAKHTSRPIIFPLSNPTEKCEATPENLLKWTNGKALMATGSPFLPVKFNDSLVTISQCNNVFAFPGIALGSIIAKAETVTDEMLDCAANELFMNSPCLQKDNTELLPSITNAKIIARKIAYAVAIQALKNKNIEDNIDELVKKKLDDYIWDIDYSFNI